MVRRKLIDYDCDDSVETIGSGPAADGQETTRKKAQHKPPKNEKSSTFLQYGAFLCFALEVLILLYAISKNVNVEQGSTATETVQQTPPDNLDLEQPAAVATTKLTATEMVALERLQAVNEQLMKAVSLAQQEKAELARELVKTRKQQWAQLALLGIPLFVVYIVKRYWPPEEGSCFVVSHLF